ncbi:hypothetical protein [Cupriavidus sp. TMH.W2]|uniref:hypothetical protein n=1 Tax=Cupriavidus sp. TMH.W2 TaxID=3434465 RepID=UPI003D77EB36
MAVDDGVYALTRFELNGQQRLFIVTELAENNGHPLSFAAERIATEILRRYGADIPPSSALFVEHYDPGVSFRGPATAECERFLEWSVTWHNRQAVFIHPKPVSKRGTH